MRLHVVNPNTSAGMTEGIGRAARAAAREGTEIVVSRSQAGPVSIEGPYDGALAVPGMLAEIARAEKESADAHLIACFDDTGLDAARSLAHAPVIGVGEAAYHMASLVADRFAVVTSTAVSVPVLRWNLVRHGLAARCAGVRAAEVPVLDIDAGGEAAVAAIRRAIGAALEGDGADAIVLGCAGMAHLAPALAEEFGVPVVESVAAGVALAEALAATGLRTSKAGAWAFPPKGAA